MIQDTLIRRLMVHTEFFTKLNVKNVLFTNAAGHRNNFPSFSFIFQQVTTDFGLIFLIK